MKGMRVMQAKKVSGSAKGKMASSAVLRSTKVQTFIGMFEVSFVQSESDKIGVRAASAHAKKAFADSAAKAWLESRKAARQELDSSDFVCIGGADIKRSEAAYSIMKKVAWNSGIHNINLASPDAVAVTKVIGQMITMRAQMDPKPLVARADAHHKAIQGLSANGACSEAQPIAIDAAADLTSPMSAAAASRPP